jgi:hypothetical protein
MPSLLRQKDAGRVIAMSGQTRRNALGTSAREHGMVKTQTISVRGYREEYGES